MHPVEVTRTIPTDTATVAESTISDQ